MKANARSLEPKSIISIKKKKSGPKQAIDLLKLKYIVSRKKKKVK
jgi:hypothetical protein